MAFTWTVTGSYTLDETSGIQTGADGTPSGSPRPDNDMPLDTTVGVTHTLQDDAPAFYTYLFTTLGLSKSYAGDVGTAESSTSFVNVTSDSGNLSTLGLTNSTGGAFTGTAIAANDSGLMTTSGHEIYLLGATIGGVDNQAVLGMYDSDGNGSPDAVAFALYMKPDGALDTNVNVQLFSVVFTPLQNPVAGTNADALDDTIDLLHNVYINATGQLHISFDNMPSGANLFNDAAESPSGGGIIVFGMTPITDSSGKYTNASDYISTSQGGTGATIGVNSQMFNPTEGAYFTYVRDIDDRFLSGVKKGLSATEADYAQNMAYASLIEAHTASVHISQIQDPNNPAGVTITAYDLNSAYQGQALLDHRGAANSGGSVATIDHVVIYAADGQTVLADSNISGAQNGITISIVSGVATVQGLSVADIIEWHTVGVHDQVLIQNTSPAGKFDIGGFDIREGSSDTHSLAGAYLEDSGPTIGNIADSIVNFTSGATTGAVTLNGSVGSDTNSGTPYVLTDWSGKAAGSDLVINGVHLTAIPNATGTDPVTGVSYWGDTNGVAGIQTTGLNPDLEFYRLTLGESGAGTYTFDVLQPPPINELHFGFGDQPAGQNLFGIIATNKANVSGTAPNATLPDGGLLFFNQGVHLDSSGMYDNASSTVNTSKGGGEVSIGYGANNYTTTGQNAFFVFADNPNTNAVGGLGLTQTTADDADTVRFNGLNPASSASVEIVKIVSGSEAGVSIHAWNLLDSQMNIDTDQEARDFLTNPITFGTDATSVNINGLQVFRETASGSQLVYSAIDKNADGDFTDSGEVSVNTGNVTVQEIGDTVKITGLDTDADYTLKYSTVTPHDMAQILWEAGSYNIGGFNIFQAQDTPDQSFNFTAQVKDGDGDTATDSWSVGIDGTGANHDGVINI